MTEIAQNILFLFQRLQWYDALDIGLVTLLFFVLLTQFRGTQAAVVMRGIAIMIVAVALLTSLTKLPAVSWILQNILPALLIVIPVVFAPEIRRMLERVGRADFFRRATTSTEIPPNIQAVVAAAKRLSERRHGALLVLERDVGLEDFASTGLRLDADVSTELLLQIFYPNTPMHDGAVILRGERLLAAGCVVPLSSGNAFVTAAERRMGLRHRAALGISEVSDAVAVVVSEETGILSVAHNGRMIRRLDPQRLQNILLAFTRSAPRSPFLAWPFFRRKITASITRPAADGSEGEERHPE